MMYHKLGGLKQQEFIYFFLVWRLEVQSQDVGWSMLPLELWREPFLASGGGHQHLAYSYITPISASVIT